MFFFFFFCQIGLDLPFLLPSSGKTQMIAIGHAKFEKDVTNALIGSHIIKQDYNIFHGSVHEHFHELFFSPAQHNNRIL